MADNGNGKRTSDTAIAERKRKMKEAVRDLPDAEPPRKVTAADAEILREAGLEELADVAEMYAGT